LEEDMVNMRLALLLLSLSSLLPSRDAKRHSKWNFFDLIGLNYTFIDWLILRTINPLLNWSHVIAFRYSAPSIEAKCEGCKAIDHLLHNLHLRLQDDRSVWVYTGIVSVSYAYGITFEVIPNILSSAIFFFQSFGYNIVFISILFLSVLL
jgi:hypothetical protein